MPHSDDRTQWTDEIPLLEDLDGKGGHAGCEYLYCDSAHEYEAQQAGWRRLGPVLALTGPKGTVPFVVMERGERYKGLAPSSTQQPLSISTYLLTGTGLTTGDLDEPPTTVVEPTPTPTATATKPTQAAKPAVPAVA